MNIYVCSPLLSAGRSLLGHDSVLCTLRPPAININLHSHLCFSYNDSQRITGTMYDRLSSKPHLVRIRTPHGTCTGEWSIGKVKSQVRDQQGYPCWSPDKELIWENSVCVLGWESARKGTLWVVKRQSRQNNKENEKKRKEETGWIFPRAENKRRVKAEGK